MQFTINNKQKIKILNTKLLNFLSKPVNIFIISIVINVILFSLFFYFINPRFETNDDIGMMEIASGLRTGQPSEYLIYINVIVGKLLVLLYSSFPGVNWYPILLYFIHFVSMTAILYCLLLKKRNIYSISIYLLLFVFFELYLLTVLQFTPTAFIAGMGGVILFFTYLETKGVGFYLAITGSIILLIISGLIRINAFYLVIGLSAVIFILKFLEKPSLVIPIFLVIILILVGLCSQFDKNYYQRNEDWGSYLEYNKLRGKIHGYSYFAYNDTTKSVYNDVGWSKNDVDMFKSWFFSDLEVYSKEKLEYVVSNIKVERGIKEIFTTLKDSFTNLYVIAKWFTGYFLIITILVIGRNRNKYFFSVLFTAFLISIYLSYFGWIPHRVFFPIIFFVNMIAAFFICTGNNIPFKKLTSNIIIRITALIICITLAAFIFTLTSNITKINKVRHQEFESAIEKIADEDKIYVYWGDTGLCDKTILFSIPQKKDKLNIIQMGWMTYSPHYYQILEKFSIDNIYEAIVKRDDIFIICPENKLELFYKFMAEHYNKSVTAIVEDRIESYEDYEIGIYKIQDNTLGVN